MVEVFKEQSYARAEYSIAVLECFVTIEQLQMGVSTIVTALALLCRASTVATFVGKNGRGKQRYRYPKIYIFVKG